MPEPSYTDDQLILTARLYFLDGLPQAQIGKMVNVSQSKVSRMLALARDRGLVRVTVPEYEPRNAALEKRIRDVLPVDPVVIRAAAALGAEHLRQTVGYFSAPVVAGLMKPGGIAGVAGGRTMRAMVENVKPSTALGGPTLVQAMGNIDATPGSYDAVELARLLATAWNGTLLTLNTPAILPNEETRRRLLELQQIRQVMETLQKADVVFAGVGTLANSVFVERGVLSPSDIAMLRKAGAVGEMLGRFYSVNGKECATKLRDQVIGMPLDWLRKVPCVVAVVSGSDRSQALAGAIRGGLIKTLVIDERGASALLEANA